MFKAAILDNVGAADESVTVSSEIEHLIVDNIAGLVETVPVVVHAGLRTIPTSQPLTLATTAPATQPPGKSRLSSLYLCYLIIHFALLCHA